MRIVLTGGPSAGKTTIAETLVRAFYDKIVLVPEAASMLYRGGFPREDATPAVICQQRAIYHVQRELEEIKALDPEGRAQICDRGTLDGLAYWPVSEEEFFQNVCSSMESELARYDWVIHLETAGEHSYQPSSIRRESFAAAQQLNQRTKQAWSKHPRRLIIVNNRNFSKKINLALAVVSMILDGATEESVRTVLFSD